MYETFSGRGVTLVQVKSPEQQWVTVFKEDKAKDEFNKTSGTFDIFPKVRLIISRVFRFIIKTLIIYSFDLDIRDMTLSQSHNTPLSH